MSLVRSLICKSCQKKTLFNNSEESYGILQAQAYNLGKMPIGFLTLNDDNLATETAAPSVVTHPPLQGRSLYQEG